LYHLNHAQGCSIRALPTNSLIAQTYIGKKILMGLTTMLLYWCHNLLSQKKKKKIFNFKRYGPDIMTYSPKWNWPDPSTTHLDWCRSRSAHVPKLRSSILSQRATGLPISLRPTLEGQPGTKKKVP
jgi:hypothetical protein